MAANVNPQAIAMANQQGRVLADALLTAIGTARSFDANYAALAGDTLYPNDAEFIEDGSSSDGRPRIQNQTMRALRTAAQDILTWAAVGSPTREARLRTIAVNGGARF